MTKIEILTEEGKMIVGISIILSLCSIFLIFYFSTFVFSIPMIVICSILLIACIYELTDTYIGYTKIKKRLSK